MREIKFRAWSNYEQKYYYNIGLINDSIYADLGDNYGEEEWINIGSVFDDDYIIEQYTGIKDRRGFDIYEGDIIEVEEKECQYNEVMTNKYQATVVFREGCFKLVEENGLMDMIYNKADKCKVIGNIHIRRTSK